MKDLKLSKLVIVLPILTKEVAAEVEVVQSN